MHIGMFGFGNNLWPFDLMQYKFGAVRPFRFVKDYIDTNKFVKNPDHLLDFFGSVCTDSVGNIHVSHCNSGFQDVSSRFLCRDYVI